MKRSIYGMVMLLVLLTAGIFTTRYMDKCHEDVIHALDQAAQGAQEGLWEQAARQLNRAKTGWEGKWGLTAALSDHAPMEQVNDLFAQLKVFLRERDAVRFCAVCARLQVTLEALGEAHSVAWWNVA